jgi:hypothetical protein
VTRFTPLTSNPVAAAREETCARLGMNLYGRLTTITDLAERGNKKRVREELLALLKFFPKEPTT